MDVAQRIKDLRLRYGWSLYRLAKLSGVSYSFLHAIENGTRVPTVTTIERICSALGIALTEFFSPISSTLHPRLQPPLDAAKNLEPWQALKLGEFLRSLQPCPLLETEPGFAQPLSREAVSEQLLLHLLRKLREHAGANPQDVDELVARAGTEVARLIDAAYKRGWNLASPLNSRQLTDALVDLLERIGTRPACTRRSPGRIELLLESPLWRNDGGGKPHPDGAVVVQSLVQGLVCCNFPSAEVTRVPDKSGERIIVVFEPKK